MRLPADQIREIFQTTEEYSNYIELYNFSSVKFQNIIFEYKIVKSGETFNGSYSKKRNIPYFADVKRINFVNDLVELGYNHSKVLKYIERDEITPNCYMYGINKSNYNFAKKLFYPFEIGPTKFEGEYAPFARLFGRLTIGKTVVPFMAKISLAANGDFGAPNFLDASFSIRLNNTGQNYTKSYPYKATIRPGQKQHVRLKIACDKSSYHKFYISANNYEGLSIRSKQISLRMLNHNRADIVTDKAFDEI